MHGAQEELNIQRTNTQNERQRIEIPTFYKMKMLAAFKLHAHENVLLFVKSDKRTEERKIK